MKRIVNLAVILILGAATVWSAEGAAPTFEEAVQECYRLTAETLFYSSNGKRQTTPNKVSGPNEIPGVCTDYALEFAYHWNEVKRYGDSFGKAYLIKVNPGASTFDISDFRFVENGTVKIRKPGSFMVNANDREVDGVYRDAIVTSVVLKGKLFPHFGQKSRNHMWVVIKCNDEWYDCEPTWWDTMPPAWWTKLPNNDYVPYKLSIGKASISENEKWKQIEFNPAPTKFEGVWRNSTEKYSDQVYEFTGNKWKYTSKKKSEWGSGYFTFTNYEITLYRENGKIWWWYGRYKDPTYKIADSFLKVYFKNGQGPGFLKQPVEEFVTSGEMFEKIQGTWKHNSIKCEYIFSGNEFKYKDTNYNYNGTFEINNGLLKLNTTNKGYLLFAYEFKSNNQLNIIEYLGGSAYITWGYFNKQ